MGENWVGVAGALALVAFIVYRRMTRLFRRQRYRTRRVLVAAGLFGLIILFLLPLLSLATGAAPVLGTALGIALGWCGYRFTKFEQCEDEIYFTPDPYVGAILFTMFVGRIVYRVLVLRNVGELATNGSGPAGLGRSPLTAALLFLLLAYYVSYYLSIWLHVRTLTKSPVHD